MLTHFRDTFRPALVLLALFTLLTGLAYPLAITGVARLAFPAEAAGSLIREGGVVRGSALIGQGFAAPGYFHGRPSAAGNGYDATNSAGSNFAPGAPELRQRIATEVAALRASGMRGPVPQDLVTASGSGLDPDISPASALAQVPRVAGARGLPETQVRALVNSETRGSGAGFLDEPRVNVLLLNRALDAAHRQHAGASARLAR